VSAVSTGSSPRRLFLLGLVSGVVYFGGAVYWVGRVMAVYGGLSWLVAAMVSALLVLYLALYPALFALLLGATVRRFGIAGVWTAPAIWVATEYGRGWIGGGFPWALLGSSQATVLPVAQLASVTGVYGLSWLVALVGTAASVMVLTPRRGHRIGVAAVGAALVLVSASGVLRMARSELTRTGNVLRVGLVQGNVPQDQKWDPAYRDVILDRYLALSRQAIGSGAQMVIWPEAATPFFLDVEAALADPIRRLAAQSRTPFLIGTDDFEPGEAGEPGRIYNSAVLIDDDGVSRGKYHKMLLVPFGEYVPLKGLLFFVSPLVEAVSDFTAGVEPVVFDADGRRFSVAICYESVYPALSGAFVARGSQLLVTITNDAWFGRSSAARQHFEQGALRAIEQGRFVVRAANTGISGVVDPYGRVLRTTALFEPAVVTADVHLLDHRTIYGYIGDVVAWASLAVSGWLAFATRRRRTGRPGTFAP
jgi:apolipoprotein N-acyltransferase